MRPSSRKTLFEPGSGRASQQELVNPAFVRSRAVSLEADWLPRAGEAIDAQVFDDTSLDITVDRTDSQSGGLFTSGHVNGHPEFRSYFGSYGNHVTAIIAGSDGRVFRIFPAKNGKHFVAELNPGAVICDGYAEAASSLQAPNSTAPLNADSSAASAASMAATLPSGNTVVDIMVLYSPEAMSNYGGSDAAMLSTIILQVGYFNETMLNSGCAVEGRLVYHGETTWHNQLGNTVSDLNWLTSDTQSGQTGALKNQYGADMVSYICYGEGGRAWLGWPYLSVIDNSGSTFTHELGHNFGCHHNVEADDPNLQPPYSYGYRLVINGLEWGDVMAYTSGHLPFYSNPSIYWQGYALGDATSADNHRLIGENAATIASERTAQIALLQQPRFISSTSFAMDLVGPTSQAGTYTVEYTGDYLSWTSLGNFSFSGGSLTITDTSDNSSTPQRFYRAKLGTAIVGSEVGFIRKTLPAGYSMVGIPLDSGDNRLSSVLPSPPDSTEILKWDAGQQTWVLAFFDSTTGWTDPNMSLGPGEGAVFDLPAATQFTFVGSVWQGFQVPLGLQWEIVSSPAPQSGPLTSTLEFPMMNYGAKIDRMTSNNVYTEYQSTGSSWTPSEPTINLSEAFWVYKTGYQFGDDTQNFWRRVFWVWP
jgi:hypothetical protein